VKEPREGWKSVAAASWRDDAKDFARKSVFPQQKNKTVGPTFHFGKSIMGNYWRLTFFSLP